MDRVTLIRSEPCPWPWIKTIVPVHFGKLQSISFGIVARVAKFPVGSVKGIYNRLAAVLHRVLELLNPSCTRRKLPWYWVGFRLVPGWSIVFGKCPVSWMRMSLELAKVQPTQAKLL